MLPFVSVFAEVCDFQAYFRMVRERGCSPFPETQSSEYWGGDAAPHALPPSRRLELESHRSSKSIT